MRLRCSISYSKQLQYTQARTCVSLFPFVLCFLAYMCDCVVAMHSRMHSIRLRTHLQSASARRASRTAPRTRIHAYLRTYVARRSPIPREGAYEIYTHNPRTELSTLH